MTGSPRAVSAAPSGRCRLCRSPLPPAVLSLGRQPLDDRALADGDADPDLAELSLATCTQCALIQLAGPPIGRVRGLIHGQGGSFSSTLRDHARAWAGSLVGGRSATGLRVLDVADGRSAVFDALRERGATVVAGSRPPDVFDAAAATRLAALGGRFDLVVADHAIAHADDLDGLLAAAAASLADGGRLAIESHAALGLVEGQFDIVSHIHRSYLSVSALGTGLRRHGLTAIDVGFEPIHGGSLRVIAERAERRSDGSEGERELRTRERVAGLDDGRGLFAVQPHAAAVAADLAAFLRRTGDRGESVAGYGAAARGATLLAFAGIGPPALPVIYDRDPNKAGRRLPATGIPIRSADKVERDRPDWLLILPWPLADEIVGELEGLRRRGTRFVVALPTLRVFG